MARSELTHLRRADVHRRTAERLTPILSLVIGAFTLGCPIGPRDFAEPPDDDGGPGPDTDGGCGSNGTCCATTCTATSGCLQDDPTNCGACGHDCQGGQCSNGKCQPVVIARAASNPTAIAVSDSNVFWTENDGLRSCPKTGCAGTPNVLSTDSAANGSLAFEGASQNLFFASCCPSFLDTYSATGARLSHAQVPASIAAIGIEADFVYWNDGTSIVRATRAGTSPTTLASGIPGRVRSFAFHPSSKTVFAACTGNAGAIIRVPMEPRPADASSDTWTSVTKFANPSSIAIANGRLYFAVVGTGPAFSDGGVYWCPVDGCTQPTPLLTGQRATAVVASMTNVYFIAKDGVYTCPLTGCNGAPTLLTNDSANTPDGPILAQDGNALYWITTAGTIVRRVK